MPHQCTPPCERHDLTNCAECSGKAASFDASLNEPDLDQGLIPGGPTIHAKFAGNCADCGRRYPAGEAIHYAKEIEGWIGVECCA